jgi:phage terminase small subunit
MPRPRLNYADAQMRGSVAVNAGRFSDRKKSPKTEGAIGNPPKYFDAALKRVWKELASSIPTGVGGKSDRQVVEMASRLLNQFRTDPLMQASRIAILMQLLSRLGLDPQARTRLQVEQKPTPKPDDEWSFLQ